MAIYQVTGWAVQSHQLPEGGSRGRGHMYTSPDPDAGKDWRQEEKGMTARDGWMASPTQWTWVRVSSGKWWRTGKPGVLQFTGLQRVGHDWVTEKQQWLIHVDVLQKPTKFCKAIILQLKNKKKKSLISQVSLLFWNTSFYWKECMYLNCILVSLKIIEY